MPVIIMKEVIRKHSK